MHGQQNIKKKKFSEHVLISLPINNQTYIKCELINLRVNILIKIYGHPVVRTSSPLAEV